MLSMNNSAMNPVDISSTKMTVRNTNTRQKGLQFAIFSETLFTFSDNHEGEKLCYPSI